MRIRIALAVATSFLALAAPAGARAGDVSGAVGLTSQLVDRGVAITEPGPVLEGLVAWNSPNGWSAAAAAAAEGRSGHVAQGLVRVAKAWSLPGDWQMQASLQYYHYSGFARLNAYEAGLAWTYRDLVTLSAAEIYAPDSRYRVRPAVDLNIHWPLPQHFFLTAGLGYTRYVISRYAHHREYEVRDFYPYAQAGLGWSDGPWRVELNRVVLRGEVRRHLDRQAASPWLATIAWSF
ncbi:MAG TPA: hypothetical protein VJ722_00220 [Rhodanobacteraceae bacterium]|nr:hypothetical protein [Rhodanobacteraceae bacterium]